MEPQVYRDSVAVDGPPPPPVAVVEQTPVVQVQPAVPVQPAVVATPAPAHVARVDSYGSFAPHAIAAGVLAIAMLVWGGVAMARAGFDGPLREPVISVAGFSGNAISGMIVAGIGLVLLLAAASRDRSAVLFVSVVTGVAALIAAIEPDMGDNVLGVDGDLPVIVAIACAFVVLIALALPTVNRSHHSIEAA